MSVRFPEESNNPSIVDEHDHSSCIGLLWVPKVYVHMTNTSTYRKFRLTYLQRIFLTLEYPLSSPISEYVSIISALVILLSIAGVIISTLPSSQYVPNTCSSPTCDNDPVLCPGQEICAPQTALMFGYIDLACVIYFALEFGTRLLLCGIMPTRISGIIPDNWDELEADRASRKGVEPQPEPDYSIYEQVIRYIFSFNSCVDIVSIVPTFVALASSDSGSKRFTIARVLRLARIFRVMRINQRGKMVVELLNRTFAASQEAVGILLFYLAMVVIFFATLVYIAEQGTYTIDSEFPYGEFIRADGFGGTTISPFDSIPTTIYFILITITTIGYGDLYPTTLFGRAVVSACAVVSIMVLALPITVVGSNFTREYDVYLSKINALKQSMKVKKKALKKAMRKSSGINLSLKSIMSRKSSMTTSDNQVLSQYDDDIGDNYDRHDDDIDENDEEDRHIAISALPAIDEGDELRLSDQPEQYSPSFINSPRSVDFSVSQSVISSNHDASVTSSRSVFSMIRFGSNATRSSQGKRSPLVKTMSFTHIIGSKQAFETGSIDNVNDDDDDEDEDDENVVVGKIPMSQMLSLSTEEVANMSRQEIALMFLSMRHAYNKVASGIKKEISNLEDLIGQD